MESKNTLFIGKISVFKYLKCCFFKDLSLIQKSENLFESEYSKTIVDGKLIKKTKLHGYICASNNIFFAVISLFIAYIQIYGNVSFKEWGVLFAMYLVVTGIMIYQQVFMNSSKLADAISHIVLFFASMYLYTINLKIEIIFFMLFTFFSSLAFKSFTNFMKNDTLHVMLLDNNKHIGFGSFFQIENNVEEKSI